MRFDTPEGPLQADIADLTVAGWTGRAASAVAHHIEELAAIGVAPPSQVPLFYRVSASLVTQAPSIQVVGESTSGEIEPLMIHARGRLWLGLASDHTDRGLETVSVAASKQICAKPVGNALWAFDEVADHLDDLILRCDIAKEGGWVRYQEGTLAAIRPLPELAAAADLGAGSAMLCGTLAALGGVRPATRYRMAMHDPVHDRTLTLSYDVTCLPVIA